MDIFQIEQFASLSLLLFALIEDQTPLHLLKNREELVRDLKSFLLPGNGVDPGLLLLLDIAHQHQGGLHLINAGPWRKRTVNCHDLLNDLVDGL